MTKQKTPMETLLEDAANDAIKKELAELLLEHTHRLILALGHEIGCWGNTNPIPFITDDGCCHNEWRIEAKYNEAEARVQQERLREVLRLIAERVTGYTVTIESLEMEAMPKWRDDEPIASLKLGARAENALWSEGFHTVGDLTKATPRLLVEDVRNFGATSLNIVREKLAERGRFLRGDKPLDREDQ